MAVAGSSSAVGGAAAVTRDVRDLKLSLLAELEERVERGAPLTEEQQALWDQSRLLMQTARAQLRDVWQPRRPQAARAHLSAAAAGNLPEPPLPVSTAPPHRLEELDRVYKEMRRRMSPSLRRKYRGFAGWRIGDYMRVFGRLYRQPALFPDRLPRRNAIGGRRRPRAAATTRRVRRSSRARAGPDSDPSEQPGSDNVAGSGPASRRAPAGAGLPARSGRRGCGIGCCGVWWPGWRVAGGGSGFAVGVAGVER